jgi:hypothetical protein
MGKAIPPLLKAIIPLLERTNPRDDRLPPHWGEGLLPGGLERILAQKEPPSLRRMRPTPLPCRVNLKREGSAAAARNFRGDLTRASWIASRTVAANNEKAATGYWA